MALSANTLLVGAPLEDSAATGVNGNQYDDSAGGSGTVYIFVRIGINWIQQAYLKASNTDGSFAAGDEFGWSVAVSGDTVVVGARWEHSAATGINGNQSDNTAVNAGASYVFVRSGTNWIQQAYLKASNTDAYDYFGESVAVSGDIIVVGAPGESSNATGVNGNQSNNGAGDAGAAYIFVRSGTNWSQQAYLKASVTVSDDNFGRSVGLSGETVVVGAWKQGMYDNGGAYVFVGSGTNWSQHRFLRASNPDAYDFFGASVPASGGTIVIGAFGDDITSFHSGAAYVFTALGIGPRLAIALDSGSGYFIRFTGAPDVTYRLQRAPSVTGMWETLSTLTAPVSGLVEFHDTTTPSVQAFYRTVQP